MNILRFFLLTETFLKSINNEIVISDLKNQNSDSNVIIYIVRLWLCLHLQMNSLSA